MNNITITVQGIPNFEGQIVVQPDTYWGDVSFDDTTPGIVDSIKLAIGDMDADTAILGFVGGQKIYDMTTASDLARGSRTVTIIAKVASYSQMRKEAMTVYAALDATKRSKLKYKAIY